MSEETDAEKIVKVLDHPARKRIIELLGTRGSMSWKELASELGTGTGALYYHVDTLEGIVTRDTMKKYALTKRGQGVYEYLRANPRVSSMQGATLAFGSGASPRRYVEALFAPRALLAKILSSNGTSLAVLIICTAILLAVTGYIGQGARLFYLAPSSDPLSILGSYALSLAAVILVSFLSTLIFFHERASLLPLAASSAFSFLPVVFFSALLAGLPALSGLLSNRNALTVVLVFFQSWSATVLAAGISVSSGVRIEKSILVSLIVLYGTMVLIFFQGTGL